MIYNIKIKKKNFKIITNNLFLWINIIVYLKKLIFNLYNIIISYIFILFLLQFFFNLSLSFGYNLIGFIL